MNTFILNSETAGTSIEHLLKQAGQGGIEVQDSDGKLLAIVLSPADQESVTYVEAHLDANEHRQEIDQALARRGGVTTAELLDKAAAASKKVAE